MSTRASVYKNGENLSKISTTAALKLDVSKEINVVLCKIDLELHADAIYLFECSLSLLKNKGT